VSEGAYKKVTSYHFDVCDEVIAITEVGQNFVVVEEARKNGQEDTHMVGVLVQLLDGSFLWDEGERSFVVNHSRALADGIRKYLDKHGIPR
jgi:hypothetical protein